MCLQETGDASDRKVSLKKQNDYLLNILYDDRGNCRYHIDCVTRIFKISKGRLKVCVFVLPLPLTSFFSTSMACVLAKLFGVWPCARESFLLYGTSLSA